MALVNESINFLKSSLEKTENGFVKIRDNKASENREQGTPGKASNKGTQLSHSATNIKDEAAMHMLLACKRNVILYDFFRIGMFSLAAHKQPSSEKHLGLLTISSSMYISTVEFQISSTPLQRNLKTQRYFYGLRPTVHTNPSRNKQDCLRLPSLNVFKTSFHGKDFSNTP